jgi:CheY-like chemotaxis protein
VIIVNAELPMIDGLDVVAELREQLPDTRIFSLSLQVDDTDDHDAF